jgi:acyl-CoA thioester hydrolase
MARIKIAIPERFIFSTEIPIRIGDINRGNHLSHVSFIVIIEEARTRFLQSLSKEEIGYLMTDLGIMYLGQGYYGQTLRIDIAVNDFTSKGFDIIYKVTDVKTGLELARAKTGVIGYDYQQQQIAQIPPGLREKISGYINH